MNIKSIKKILSILCVVLIAVGVFTACTKDNNNQSKEASTIDPENSKVVEKAEIRVISTVKGDVEVPITPKRIIPTPYRPGDLISLGIIPIATGEIYEGAAFYDLVKDIPIISTWEPEEIMNLEPDLIFTSDENSYDKFTKIAPTVFIPFDMDTLERIELIANTLGIEEKFDEVTKSLDDKVAEGKIKLKEAGLYDKTISIYEAWEEGSMMIVGNKWGRGGNLIYDFLELKPNELVKKNIIDGNGDPYSILSLEVIDQYAGDYIVFSLGWDSETDLSKNPVWNSIAAVKEEKIVSIDSIFFYYDDMYSVMAQMDYLIDTLLEVSQR